MAYLNTKHRLIILAFTLIQKKGCPYTWDSLFYHI